MATKKGLGINMLIHVEPLRLETGRKPALKEQKKWFKHDQLQRKSLLPGLTTDTRVLDRIQCGCL